ncbi:MAG: hypothetical protein ACD_2C00209G0011 [uncultured bacterium (gcode 4)]|uniref:Uncharacterized protein n=1 Tax=uncultured bacterium (gcode 4) TaxID=1234023 RepID=K2G4F2_9BACT|nr:MAG: hypothetical protein ACD_2C00209G0011 [uncultured bacterium (gcode 4)]
MNLSKSALYKEDSSTSLIWIIWVFIILISFIWNNQTLKWEYLKSSITEGIYANAQLGKIYGLKEWWQVLNIDWREYIVTVISKK